MILHQDKNTSYLCIRGGQNGLLADGGIQTLTLRYVVKNDGGQTPSFLFQSKGYDLFLSFKKKDVIEDRLSLILNLQR